jgi:hypothetical protein
MDATQHGLLPPTPSTTSAGSYASYSPVNSSTGVARYAFQHAASPTPSHLSVQTGPAYLHARGDSVGFGLSDSPASPSASLQADSRDQAARQLLEKENTELKVELKVIR